MSASTKDTDVARAVASRRANTYLRLGATLAICVILDLFVGMRWIWIWGALYTAIQLLETWLAIRIIKQERSDNGRWPRLSVMVLPFLTSAAFGSLAIPMFASEARFAPTLGGMLLAGALMNVVIVNGSLRLATETVGDQVRLLIEVVDTGPGIPEEALPRLFTPFDQLNASVVRQHGGSGLGLAISRELARLMGGDLVAANARGQGACFRLSVLLETTDAPDVPVLGPSISGLQVLVVDDHVVNRRAIELVLQPFGVEATLAESGEEALELLRSEVFDAILMDVYVPGMDGRETTRALRAGAGPNRDAPVIAVTASATIKDWEACAAAGMNAHVAKPIDPMELFSALAQVMAARSGVGPIGSEVVASSA